MTQIKIKRVYDEAAGSDGYRVLVDRLWPRGIKKEALKYDYWAKEVAPSTPLREWFHTDIEGRWDEFKEKYQKELDSSADVAHFLKRVREHSVVTLLYASKEPVYNQALILQEYLEKHLNE